MSSDEGPVEFAAEEDVLSAPGVAEAIDAAILEFERWRREIAASGREHGR